jgi:hypothetical protein
MWSTGMSASTETTADPDGVDPRLARAGWRFLARHGWGVEAVGELIEALPRLQGELAALADPETGCPGPG